MSTNELILDILGKMDKKIDNLDAKMESKFGNLKCGEQNIRIDRIEQREKDQQEHKAKFWAIALAALGAFGLSVWNWITKQ